jgi:hypothetical protein
MRTHYGPWQPCWISNQHQKHKSSRGPSNEHFWQVWLKSVQRFQSRKFKCEKLADGRTLTHDKSSPGHRPGELKTKQNKKTISMFLFIFSFSLFYLKWHYLPKSQILLPIKTIGYDWCLRKTCLCNLYCYEMYAHRRKKEQLLVFRDWSRNGRHLINYWHCLQFEESSLNQYNNALISYFLRPEIFVRPKKKDFWFPLTLPGQFYLVWWINFIGIFRRKNMEI